jgi:cytoskeletal protein RodZ
MHSYNEYCKDCQNIVQSLEKGETMALFRRKPKEAVLPEVDKYYEGERRDRAGLAWLLALVSVAIVALVIVGVFLAGRWAYRQVADNGDGDVSISDTADNNTPSFDGESNRGSEGENSEDETDQTEEAPASENGETAEQENGQPAAETPTSDSDNSNDSDSTPETTPATGDNEALPNTGPADTAAIFAVVSTAAGLTHYAVSRKRSN